MARKYYLFTFMCCESYHFILIAVQNNKYNANWVKTISWNQKNGFQESDSMEILFVLVTMDIIMYKYLARNYIIKNRILKKFLIQLEN